jgi:hypothetical protein
MIMLHPTVILALAANLGFSSCIFAAELPANEFVGVGGDDTGGHFFSQVIYAPSIDAAVSWGTRILVEDMTSSRSGDRAHPRSIPHADDA